MRSQGRSRKNDRGMDDKGIRETAEAEQEAMDASGNGWNPS
jgi:hypothetical protein